ncbi:MAG: hypothetical protein CL678_04880 [Bdellovibrionaceae bacterium]|nr:hypothetical protein [Pseudobdellovibrionaceae bacterium]|tara:strand:- start:783 stop:1655 length:873 start_codon:yes stop_codon:yes gene_type:complete
MRFTFFIGLLLFSTSLFAETLSHQMDRFRVQILKSTVEPYEESLGPIVFIKAPTVLEQSVWFTQLKKMMNELPKEVNVSVILYGPQTKPEVLASPHHWVNTSLTPPWSIQKKFEAVYREKVGTSETSLKEFSEAFFKFHFMHGNLNYVRIIRNEISTLVAGFYFSEDPKERKIYFDRMIQLDGLVTGSIHEPIVHFVTEHMIEALKTSMNKAIESFVLDLLKKWKHTSASMYVDLLESFTKELKTRLKNKGFESDLSSKKVRMIVSMHKALIIIQANQPCPTHFKALKDD